MGRTLQLGDTQVDETKLADLCGRYRVRELSLFGSAAPGAMRPDSDIDMLVSFLPDADIDLVDYAGLMLDLASPRAESGPGVEERTETADPSVRARRSAALVCGMRACTSRI